MRRLPHALIISHGSVMTMSGAASLASIHWAALLMAASEETKGYVVGQTLVALEVVDVVLARLLLLIAVRPVAPQRFARLPW
jgi:hypothetical protein